MGAPELIPPSVPPALLVLTVSAGALGARAAPALATNGSLCVEPRITVPPKPEPISKPLVAGSDIMACANMASSRSKTGSPSPAGTPLDLPNERRHPARSRRVRAAQWQQLVGTPLVKGGAGRRRNLFAPEIVHLALPILVARERLELLVGAGRLADTTRCCLLASSGRRARVHADELEECLLRLDLVCHVGLLPLLRVGLLRLAQLLVDSRVAQQSQCTVRVDLLTAPAKRTALARGDG
eukprot:scaffold158378_cov27-Tisochrysis_lutea.AAC.2